MYGVYTTSNNRLSNPKSTVFPITIWIVLTTGSSVCVAQQNINLSVANTSLDKPFHFNGQHHSLPTVEVSSDYTVWENESAWKLHSPIESLPNRNRENIHIFTIFITSTYPLNAYYEGNPGSNLESPDWLFERMADDFLDTSSYRFKIKWVVYLSFVNKKNSSFEFRSNVEPFLGISIRYFYDDQSSITSISASPSIPSAFYEYINSMRNEDETKVCNSFLFVSQSINLESGLAQHRYHCALNGKSGTTSLTRHIASEVVVINDKTYRTRKSCWKWCSKSFHCNPQELWYPGQAFQRTLSATCSPRGSSSDGSENEETLYSPPIITSLPQGKNQTTEIYFSMKDVKPEKMISLIKFDEYQYLYTTIELRCTVSEYYASIPFQFALQYKHRSALEFLRVMEGGHHFKFKHATRSASNKIMLNSTMIERIFCFAPVRGSFDWINASRPVHVLDCSNSHLKLSSIKEAQTFPRIELMAAQHESLYSGRGNVGNVGNTTFVDFNRKVGESYHIIQLQCKAQYPIRLYVESNSQNQNQNEHKLKVSYLTIQRQIEDFYDSSTYNYSLSANFELNRETKVFIHCKAVSMENLCLATTVQAQPAADERFIAFVNTSIKRTMLDLQSKFIEESDCEFLLYYSPDETSAFHSYTLQCEMEDDTPGEIVITPCELPFTLCTEQFHLITQPTHCTRKHRRGECNDCPEHSLSRLEPVFVKCKPLKLLNPSLYGNFVFFGISPTTTTQRPQIYFDEADIDTKAMLSMDKLSDAQFINTKIVVTCRASAYYTANPVIFALQFDSVEKLSFISSVQTENKRNEHLMDAVYEYTSEIFLNSTKVERIYCFAPLQKSSGWINSSRPIEVKYFSTPMIVKDEDNIIAYKDQGTDSNRLQFTKQFQLGSKNETLSCSATGDPVPKITWIRNHVEIPENNGELRPESNLKRSQLVFPKIDKTAEGIYICRATNMHGKAEATFNILVDDKSGLILAVAIGVPLLVVLVSLFVIVFLIIKLRNWRNLRQSPHLTEQEYQDFMNGNSIKNSSEPHSAIFNGAFDPKYILPRDKLKFALNDLLGSGNYGVVMRGWYCEGVDNFQRAVAVKTIKPRADTMHFKALLSEVKIMAYLGDHPNIVQFLGACIENIQNGEIYAAVEFCQKGDLREYLKRQNAVLITNSVALQADRQSVSYATNGNPGSPGVYENSQFPHSVMMNLLGWARDIALGLEYLSSKNVIHGDLAARNVLLTKDLNAKISDFGLSRQLLNDYSVYMKKSRVPLPWKWMALESITSATFSVQSDVWSYGITLWEMFSLGESPYPGMRYDEHFMEKLSTGYRPSKPAFANAQLYEIMLQCWKKDPKGRPEISCFCRQFKDILTQYKNLGDKGTSGRNVNYTYVHANVNEHDGDE